MIYTVYKHTNKINGKVYIGITSQSVERRWQKGAGYTGQVFGNAIKKYGWDGFTHEIIATGLSKQEACDIEKKLISKYKSNNHINGYNVAEGGQVVAGNHERKGKLNHRSRPVNCFDKAHNLIATYESQNIAAIELGVKRKGITKNCLGESRTYKGYIFEYADCDFKKPKKYPIGKHPNHRKRAVKLVDEDNNIIKVFSSIKEASEECGCNANGINKCCKGLLKTYLGKRWLYA